MYSADWSSIRLSVHVLDQVSRGPTGRLYGHLGGSPEYKLIIPDGVVTKLVRAFDMGGSSCEPAELVRHVRESDAAVFPSDGNLTLNSRDSHMSLYLPHDCVSTRGNVKVARVWRVCDEEQSEDYM